MTSADDGEPREPGVPDERLQRAFDRAARLGIDVDPAPEPEPDPATREREAVRAFTALHLGTVTPGAEAPPAGDPDPPSDVAGATDGPASTTADQGGPTPPPPDEGPLRPDAVLRGRKLNGEGGGEPVVTGEVPRVEIEVDVSPPDDEAGRPASAGDPASATRVTAPDVGDVGAVDRYLLDLGAVALATGALVTPWVWMAVVAVATGLAMAHRGAAAAGAGPRALAGRLVRWVVGWLRPRTAVWAAVLAVRVAVLAVLVPGLVGAAWWAAREGIDGTLLAARLAVWRHGFRVGAAVICYLLVAGVGDAHERRAAALRAAARRAGTPATVAAAVGTALAASLVVVVAPRADAGRLAGDDGLGWLPPRLRDEADRVRDDVVAAELHAASGCLADRQGVTWDTDYTAGNPIGTTDVARLVAVEGLPTPGQVATAVAALHNQLAPWVEQVHVVAGDVRLAVVHRSDLPSGEPLVDPDRLPDAASTGAELLADGAADFDRTTALTCAGAPLP
ncbi:MAG: hypothetical protein FWJ72_04960 [Acidimicrobiia bacterium]